MKEYKCYIALRCDCGEETVVFSKYDWNDVAPDYEISIEDAYCVGGYTGIKGRFKRAWSAFFAKPICYNSVLISDKSKMLEFLNKCAELVKAESKDE